MIKKEISKIISIAEEAGIQHERNESETYHQLLELAYDKRDILVARLEAADALAIAAEKAENAMEVLMVCGDTDQVLTARAALCELGATLRQYREAT